MVAQHVQQRRVGLGADLLRAAVHRDGRGRWRLFCHISRITAARRDAPARYVTPSVRYRKRQVELTPRMRPSRNASTKCRWSSRTCRGVVEPEGHHVVDELVVAVADQLRDRVLGLELDELLVAVGVTDAVHLGDGTAELLDHLGQFVGFGQLGPVEVGLVRRQFRDDVTDPVDLGVAEQRVGVRLQRALRHRRAVSVMLEVLVHLARRRRRGSVRRRCPASSTARCRCRAPG